MGSIREAEGETKTESDVSGDEQGLDYNPPGKKPYHRHTPLQIQELERLFKECPHPDDKRRLEISKRLNLETRQIKFWFQNRRTQMKTQLERHGNMILKQENEKLHAENYAIKQSIQHLVCNSCGGPAVLGEISHEEYQLRIENARLKDELGRICALADRFLSKPVEAMPGLTPPSIQCSTLDHNGGMDGVDLISPAGAPLSMFPVMPTASIVSRDRSFLLDQALLAMHELVCLAEADSPLWRRSLDGRKEFLNHEEYRRKFILPCLTTKPSGFITVATRETSMVNTSSSALVEVLMDADQWAKMFPYMIATSSMIEVIARGMGGTKNGALQLMQAELQILSPLVPLCKVKFARFCKQHAEGMWAVVDVSFDLTRESSDTADPSLSCQRLALGCVVQDVCDGGYSKVTFVEHLDYDESLIHRLYRPLICSGHGFGARRWLAALQNQCSWLGDRRAPTSIIPVAGREKVLDLAQRMADIFCAGIRRPEGRDWEPVDGAKTLGLDVKVRARADHRAVLCASTSVWVPAGHRRLFDFLRDHRARSEWDALSAGGPMRVMLSLPPGGDRGNCVSLLHGSEASPSRNGMVILQKTWTDEVCSMVVYAPVDGGEIQAVMGGGDSSGVALLPSGFSVYPDGCAGEGEGGGSLLTIGFQIMVNGPPATHSLTADSVQTVCRLISASHRRIQDVVRDL